MTVDATPLESLGGVYRVDVISVPLPLTTHSPTSFSTLCHQSATSPYAPSCRPFINLASWRVATPIPPPPNSTFRIFLFLLTDLLPITPTRVSTTPHPSHAAHALPVWPRARNSGQPVHPPTYSPTRSPTHSIHPLPTLISIWCLHFVVTVNPIICCICEAPFI